MKNRFKKHGFSLVEVMIAASVLAVVTLGTMKLTERENKNLRSTAQRLEIDNFLNEVRILLADKESCFRNFSNDGTVASFNPTLIGRQSLSLNNNLLDANGNPVFTNNSSVKYGNGMVIVDGMDYGDWNEESDVPGVGKVGTFKLYIRLKKSDQSIASDVEKEVEISANIDLSSLITGCNSSATEGIGYWKAEGGGINYGRPTVPGVKVGIMKKDDPADIVNFPPQAHLHVEDQDSASAAVVRIGGVGGPGVVGMPGAEGSYSSLLFIQPSNNGFKVSQTRNNFAKIGYFDSTSGAYRPDVVMDISKNVAFGISTPGADWDIQTQYPRIQNTRLLIETSGSGSSDVILRTGAGAGAKEIILKSGAAATGGSITTNGVSSFSFTNGTASLGWNMSTNLLSLMSTLRISKRGGMTQGGFSANQVSALDANFSVGYTGGNVNSFVSSSSAVNGITVSSSGGRLISVGAHTASKIIATSDRRIKEDIKTVTDPISKLKKLQGVTFRWKKSNKKSAGFIAQDVEKVLPELVETNKKSGLKHLKYSGFSAVLIETIKDHQNRINRLDQLIFSQDEEIQLLEENLSKLSKSE